MTIKNRANGPTFSTDAVAHDVSRFISQRREIPEYSRPSKASPGPILSPEELYPSLYEVRAPGLGQRVARLVRHARSVLIRSLVRRRGGRRGTIATGLALTCALTMSLNGPARADVPMYANGYGHAAEVVDAYDMALQGAQAALESECYSEEDASTERLLESNSRWTGTEFQVTVRLSILCR